MTKHYPQAPRPAPPPPAVKLAEERWRKGLARERERAGYDPRNHQGSRA